MLNLLKDIRTGALPREEIPGYLACLARKALLFVGVTAILIAVFGTLILTIP